MQTTILMLTGKPKSDSPASEQLLLTVRFPQRKAAVGRKQPVVRDRYQPVTDVTAFRKSALFSGGQPFINAMQVCLVDAKSDQQQSSSGLSFRG